MLWSVAGRFHFSDSELRGMRTSRLRFWYRGHGALDREEVARLKTITGGGNDGA